MSSNKLPPEDIEEWQNFSANIKPIKHRVQPPELPNRKLPKFFPDSSPPPTFSTRTLPSLQPGEKSGVDRNSFESLQKGNMPVEARLDLHGKSFAQAFRIFKEFITKAITDGKRCVLVITGKGRPEAESTLHDSLPDWINHQEIRPFIVTYTQASPRQGGSGAYTILLKRRRDYIIHQT